MSKVKVTFDVEVTPEMFHRLDGLIVTEADSMTQTGEKQITFTTSDVPRLICDLIMDEASVVGVEIG